MVMRAEPEMAADDDPAVRVRRVYDPAEPADGFRVLVDRLWPRGLSAERARVDLWLSAVAPSHELRRRWHHEPDRREEFAAQYRTELDANPAVAQLVEVLVEHPVVTLLYGARDRTGNHALVLADYLAARSTDPPAAPPTTGGADA